jgi:hypothetical protein
MFALLLAPMAAHADVVELKSGQKVEGAFKSADATSVKIEIGGQVMTFKPEQVRAIYYGKAPTATDAVSPTDEAMKALRGLRAIVDSGSVTFRDFAPRVSDAAVIVDRYLQSDQTATPLRAHIMGASAFYSFASAAWGGQISKSYAGLGSNPMIPHCPPLRDKLAAGPTMRGMDPAMWRDVSTSFEVPTILACAATQVGEAEKLLGSK